MNLNLAGHPPNNRKINNTENDKTEECKRDYLTDFNYCLYDKENVPYISPIPGEFPIIASDSFPHSSDFAKSIVDDIIECGFNVGAYSSHVDNMNYALRMIKGTNLKMIIAPGGARNWTSDLLANWKREFFENAKFKAIFSDPAVTAWYFKDEPEFSLLDEIEKSYESICLLDSGRMQIVVLVGSTKGTTVPDPDNPGEDKIVNNPYCGEHITNKNYIRYLELIQEKIAPPVWIYDLYPITKTIKKDGVAKYAVKSKQFYEDLEASSRIASLTHRPFWAYCMSMSHQLSYDETSGEGVLYPEATLGSLRFEAFSALAYGAQGIIYWTYCQIYNDAIHYSALINQQGEKSESWYYAKQVNGEIKALTDVFLGCTLMRVRHTGNDANINSVTCPLTSAEPMWPLESASSSGSGLLVSHLSNKGRDYLVIVSHDPLNSQTVSLKFRNHWTFRTVNPIAEVKKLTKSDDGTRTVYSGTLPAGGYIVFEWS